MCQRLAHGLRAWPIASAARALLTGALGGTAAVAELDGGGARSISPTRGACMDGVLGDRGRPRRARSPPFAVSCHQASRLSGETSRRVAGPPRALWRGWGRVPGSTGKRWPTATAAHVEGTHESPQRLYLSRRHRYLQAFSI